MFSIKKNHKSFWVVGGGGQYWNLYLTFEVLWRSKNTWPSNRLSGDSCQKLFCFGRRVQSPRAYYARHVPIIFSFFPRSDQRLKRVVQKTEERPVLPTKSVGFIQERGQHTLKKNNKEGWIGPREEIISIGQTGKITWVNHNRWFKAQVVYWKVHPKVKILCLCVCVCVCVEEGWWEGGEGGKDSQLKIKIKQVTFQTLSASKTKQSRPVCFALSQTIRQPNRGTQTPFPNSVSLTHTIIFYSFNICTYMIERILSFLLLCR